MLSIGLVKLPLFYEGEKITILARVFRDLDFPKGRDIIIRNNHQYLRHTIIDFKEMMYYMTTENGNVVAIPGSVGKGFNVKLPDKILLKTCTTMYFYIPPGFESSKEIEIILNAEGMDVPFSFKHKTLLLVEGFENPQLKPARGIIQAEGDKSYTLF